MTAAKDAAISSSSSRDLETSPAGSWSPGKPNGRQATLALLLLTCGNVLNHYDRLLISVAAPQLKSELQLSDTQYGFLSGLAFVLIYAMAGMVISWIADRKSRRIVVVTALGFWSAMTMLCGLAQNFVQLLFARAAVGVGEAGYIPASYSFLSASYAPRQRAKVFAVFNVGIMIGVLLAFLAGGWLVVNYGWRVAFLVSGIPGFLLALVILISLREPKADEDKRADVLTPKAAFGMVKQDQAYIWLLLGSGMSSFCNIGIIQWMPLFFQRSHDLSLSQIGLFFGPILAVGMMTGMAVGGWIAHRLSRESLARPIVIGIWANLLVGPVYWLTLFLPSASLSLCFMFVGAALSMLFSPALSAAIQNTCDARLRASAIAMMVLTNSLLGMGFLPFLVGVLSDAGYTVFGKDSLRYAIALILTANLVAALAFARAKIHMQRREMAV